MNRAALHFIIGSAIGVLSYAAFKQVWLSVVITVGIGYVFEVAQRQRSVFLPEFLQGEYDIMDVLVTGTGGLVGALFAQATPTIVEWLNRSTLF